MEKGIFSRSHQSMRWSVCARESDKNAITEGKWDKKGTGKKSR